MDTLALSDALLHAPELPIVAPQERKQWWLDFKYEDYDWDDPEFLKKNRGKEAYKPVLLTQGYFMMVPVQAYKKMTVHPNGKSKTWHPKIDLDEKGNIVKVYASRRGHKKLGEPDTVYAHRELLGLLYEPSMIGDHTNHCGLDNRLVNLISTGRRENNNNSARLRSVHVGLLPGVEKRGKNRDGKQRYGGKVCIRLSRKKVRTIRSRIWLSPEPAARWYLNYLKRTHRRTKWVHDPKSVCQPFFPPKWESEPAVQKRRIATPAEKFAEQVPF